MTRRAQTVRTVVLEGARISRPPFYVEAVELASGSFPDLVHLASVTYVDITVFNERIEPTTDFHGLVHAQQFAELGMNGYAFRLKYKRANRGDGFDFSNMGGFRYKKYNYGCAKVATNSHFINSDSCKAIKRDDHFDRVAFHESFLLWQVTERPELAVI